MDTTVELEHPVVFLFDESHARSQIPSVGPAVVSTTNSCVAIRTIADVDGPVHLILENGDTSDPDDEVTVFDGLVETPGGRISLVSAENRVLLSTAGQLPETRVQIVVDDVAHPSKVRVIVLGPRAR